MIPIQEDKNVLKIKRGSPPNEKIYMLYNQGQLSSVYGKLKDDEKDSKKMALASCVLQACIDYEVSLIEKNTQKQLPYDEVVKIQTTNEALNIFWQSFVEVQKIRRSKEAIIRKPEILSLIICSITKSNPTKQENEKLRDIACLGVACGMRWIEYGEGLDSFVDMEDLQRRISNKNINPNTNTKNNAEEVEVSIEDKIRDILTSRKWLKNDIDKVINNLSFGRVADTFLSHAQNITGQRGIKSNKLAKMHAHLRDSKISHCSKSFVVSTRKNAINKDKMLVTKKIGETKNLLISLLRTKLAEIVHEQSPKKAKAIVRNARKQRDASVGKMYMVYLETKPMEILHLVDEALKRSESKPRYEYAKKAEMESVMGAVKNGLFLGMAANKENLSDTSLKTNNPADFTPGIF